MIEKLIAFSARTERVYTEAAAQAGGIVSPHLAVPHAQGRRAVEFLHHECLDGLESALIVGAHGRDEYHEQVFIGGSESHLGAGPDDQGPDVKRRADAVGNPVVINFQQGMDVLETHVHI